MNTTMGMEKAKVWLSETVGTKIAARLFRGLALGALLVAATGLYFTINQGEAGSPLVSEQSEVPPEFRQTEIWFTSGDLAGSSPVSERIGCYPEDNVVCLYGQFLADVLAEPGLTTGSPLSNEQLEFTQDLEMMGVPWRIDAEGKVVVVEAARKPIAGSPSVREQSQCYPELDNQCSLGVNKVDSPSSINGMNEVWTEIEDTPIHHLTNQLKAGSPASINGIRCYPEDNC
jgi:hypothetical protein